MCLKISNQNLQSADAPDLLIISHPDFKSEAIRLGNHRQANDGLAVTIVTPEEIYNEYASGKQDVTAIRDFIRDVYVRGNQKLKYVLLFGRGSYDFKNRIADLKKSPFHCDKDPRQFGTFKDSISGDMLKVEFQYHSTKNMATFYYLKKGSKK